MYRGAYRRSVILKYASLIFFLHRITGIIFNKKLRFSSFFSDNVDNSSFRIFSSIFCYFILFTILEDNIVIKKIFLKWLIDISLKILYNTRQICIQANRESFQTFLIHEIKKYKTVCDIFCESLKNVQNEDISTSCSILTFKATIITFIFTWNMSGSFSF